MEIITQPISLNKVKEMAKKGFGNLVKAVVDIDKKIMAIDAELHSDEEALLLQQGSRQEDLWGINLYPQLDKAQWIEFDSMINIRPRQNNLSRGVEDEAIRQKIIEVVNNLVVR